MGLSKDAERVLELLTSNECAHASMAVAPDLRELSTWGIRHNMLVCAAAWVRKEMEAEHEVERLALEADRIGNEAAGFASSQTKLEFEEDRLYWRAVVKFFREHFAKETPAIEFEREGA